MDWTSIDWWLSFFFWILIGLLALFFVTLECLVYVWPYPGKPRTDSSRTSVDEEAEDLRSRVGGWRDAFRRDLSAFREETIGRWFPSRNRDVSESRRTEAEAPPSEREDNGGSEGRQAQS